jgi:tripartite-type tricarboxylate transporter receptor subunit TctC
VDSHIKSGKLKVLGVTEKTRYPGLPDVPAIGETVKGFDMESWLAIFAPANTPRAVVDKLNAAVVKTLGTAKVRDKLNSMGLLVVGSSAGEMASMQAAYVKSSGALIKSQGIKAE